MKYILHRHLCLVVAMFLLSHFMFSSAQLGQTGWELEIAPGFQPDPLSFDYISGGPINAEEKYGSECKGFVNAVADHVMHVKKDFSYLRIAVESSSDTTLIVSPQNGQPALCNDDTTRGNQNPSIFSAFTTGTYEIFVGSYEGEGSLANYSIIFTESRP